MRATRRSPRRIAAVLLLAAPLLVGAGDVRLSTQAAPSSDRLQSLLLQVPGEDLATVRLLRAGADGFFDLEPEPGQERLLHILGGPVVIELPDGQVQLAAGDAVFIPTGQATRVSTADGGELEVLDALVPASAATRELAPLVVRGDDAATYALQDGKLRVKILVDRERLGAEGAALSLLTAHAGAATAMHEHVGSDEIVVVLEGNAKMLLQGARMTLGPRSAIHIPAGASHSMVVDADNPPLRVVQIYTPGGPEQRFKKGETVD